MNIESAKFIKGVLGSDSSLESNTPQVAFIGRSNSGKSSVINSLVNQNNLATTSSFPGRTQKINLFLINDSLYFVDLPGYGYAKVPDKLKNVLKDMVNWYFFVSNYEQKKIVLIIDANVGPTKDDLEMLYALEDYRKDIIVVANKIDKIKKTRYEEQFKTIKELIGNHKIIPYSAKKKIGVKELLNEIFN
ncbi:MAG TPA: ribosome biogenesis GTP-binding protein YihA/YsxC [Candidatus Pacearchaeota archaeon]|nr:ribosome biogenesis GTP-binding protein YihA/YsxC [Candidatus Pacearchaeota archaeon]HPR79923.1 ribosome biogenesis GTP-binding protein YihA/YsxC [Candidatus Pacearchaeota archaeon]